MPLYAYTDEETGVTIELNRKVEDRDKPIVLVRASKVPDRITIHGLEPSPEQDFDTKILKAYYRKEEKEGSRFNGGEFTKSQIKKAWTQNV